MFCLLFGSAFLSEMMMIMVLMTMMFIVHDDDDYWASGLGARGAACLD